jgi:hypothetical protein
VRKQTQCRRNNPTRAEPKAGLGVVVEAPRARGTIAMAGRDDLGARNVPAIDWLELFIWTLLITMSSALALVVIR